jgi:hypothetical protein
MIRTRNTTFPSSKKNLECRCGGRISTDIDMPEPELEEEQEELGEGVRESNGGSMATLRGWGEGIVVL